MIIKVRKITMLMLEIPLLEDLEVLLWLKFELHLHCTVCTYRCIILFLPFLFHI